MSLWILIQVCVMVGEQNENTKNTTTYYILFTCNSFYGLSNLRCSVVRSPKKGVACIAQMFNVKGDKMEKIMEVIDTVLKNRSLTIFLGIALAAMLFGWVGGAS